MPDRLPSPSRLAREAAALWPEERLRRFRAIEAGWTHLVLEADRRFIFRFPRRAAAARELGREVRVLEYLANRLSAPIPVVERFGTLSSPAGWPFLSYRRLPGDALPEFPSLSPRGQRRLGAFLAVLLQELAEIPTRSARRLGLEPGDPARWAREYERLLERYDRVGSRRLTPDLDRRIRDEFAEALPLLASARFRPVVAHRDLGPFNLLWDRRADRPTGVIDWEDIRLGDPAFDLTGLGFLDVGIVASLARGRRAPPDDSFEERLAFYRRMMPLQEMLFALENRRSALFRRKRRELSSAFAGPGRRGRRSDRGPRGVRTRRGVGA